MHTMLQKQDQQWVESVIQKFTTKLDWVSEKSKYKIPYMSVNGTHDDRAAENPSGSEADGSAGGPTASGAG